VEHIKFSIPEGYAKSINMELRKTIGGKAKYKFAYFLGASADGYLRAKFKVDRMVDRFLSAYVVNKLFHVNWSRYDFKYKVVSRETIKNELKCHVCGGSYTEEEYELLFILVHILENGIDVTSQFYYEGKQSEEAIGKTKIVRQIEEEVKQEEYEKQKRDPLYT